MRNIQKSLAFAIGASAAFVILVLFLYWRDRQPTGRIAFVTGNFGHSNERKIWLIGFDGSKRKSLSKNDGSPGEDRPAWSIDGRRVAFSAVRGGKRRIYTVGRDGSNEVCITPNLHDCDSPTWSPDYKKLAFVRWLKGRKTSHVFVVDTTGAGTGLEQLTQNTGPVSKNDQAERGRFE